MKSKVVTHHKKDSKSAILVRVPDELLSSFWEVPSVEWERISEDSWRIKLNPPAPNGADDRLSFKYWLQREGYTKNTIRVYGSAVGSYLEGKEPGKGYKNNYTAAVELYKIYKCQRPRDLIGRRSRIAKETA